jgi:fructose-1,6-bisphosphatase/inositol monophosphatase family enzyme
MPDISVSIGLAVAKRPVLGVIFDPCRNELFAAYTVRHREREREREKETEREERNLCIDQPYRCQAAGAGGHL